MDLKVATYQNLALVMIRGQKFAEAVEVCTTALAVEPETVKAIYLRGQAHAGLQDYKAAVADLKTAMERQEAAVQKLGPEDPKLRAELVNLKAIKRNYSDAARNLLNPAP